MRAVVQRVTRARVVVDGETVGRVDTGLVVLLGVGAQDTEADADALADKIVGLRVFDDPWDSLKVLQDRVIPHFR